MSTSSSRQPAVLLDIDGSLVDSNYLHIHAWRRAFTEVGIAADSWRIHRSIGMDGAALLDSLSGDAEDSVKQQAKDLHSRYYKQSASLLRLLPGARDLMHEVESRDLQVVLATSAPEDELELLREVLESDELVSTMTSSEDVDTAKPKPDIVEVALQRAGVEAARAVFVGDSVWDAEASARAEVTCIGLLSGGISSGELRRGGASAVFDDAADLCRHITRSPIAALIPQDARKS